MRNLIKELYFNSSKKIIQKKYPVPPYIILFLNDKCWTRCRHCWYNEQWQKSHLLKKGNMSFEELEKFSKNIKTIHFLSLAGGEAFLRDDIVELTKMFNSNIKISKYDIPTSGFDTDMIAAKTEKILKSNPHIPFRVDISLDGLQNTHDAIRNREGTFSNAIETLKELKKIRQKFDYFDVSLITTISADNQEEIKEIAELVEHILPDGEWMVNIVRGETRIRDERQVDLDNYLFSHSFIEKRMRNKEYSGDKAYKFGKWLTAKNHLRRKIIVNILQGQHHTGLCSAGLLALVIYNEGSVYACEMQDIPLGNLRDFGYNLSGILRRKEVGAVLKDRYMKNCICTHECFLSLSILMQPALIRKLITERIKLSF